MARIRTFIAVGLDEAVRERAVALQGRLARTGPSVKWVEPENMHITLLFLGEVDELEVLAVCRAVEKAAKPLPPFAMNLVGLGCFPTPRRPKILWVGVKEGAEELRRLHATLEAPLLEMGCYRREERDYTPHLTLGRLTQEDRAGAWGPVLTKHADWECGETPVREVLVMSSELRREGPVYTVLSRAKLLGTPPAEGAPDAE